jgi:4-hydroxy-tetrahydrodipicolinate synthase
MTERPHLSGVFAAAVTPLDANGQLELDSLPAYLSFLARRGCHGALLLGTTGEGPSFAHHERVKLMKTALQVRQDYPEFRLLAGTGTPSLEETIVNTRATFDHGLDGVVVLPPYYYRSANDEGLFAWYSRLIQRAVPSDGALLGYHIPAVSGVPLSLTLLSRLKDTYPGQFAGLKDSSGSLEHARQLGEQFGKDLVVFNGNDRLFSAALQASASGCITAMASLCSPILRRVWDAHLQGGADPHSQVMLDDCRSVMDKIPPAPPLLKSMLTQMHNFPRWAVRPPLQDLSADIETIIAAELIAALLAASDV